MRIVRAAILVLAGLALGGCFSDSNSDGQSSIGPTNPTSGNGAPPAPPAPPVSTFKATFQPGAGILPYPTDLYFSGTTDGTLNLPVTPFSPAVGTINALDGFSTTAYISERFANGSIDPATLTAANIRVVRLALDNATKAPLIPPAPGGALPVPLTFGTDFTASIAQEAGSNNATLVIKPTRPLEASGGLPGNSLRNIGYLVILTNGIRSTTGIAAVADADYATVRNQALAEIAAGATTPTCTPITNATLNGICRLTFAHLRVAGAIGVTPLTNVVLTFAFSTQSTSDSLTAISGVPAQTIGAQFAGPTSAFNPMLPGIANVHLGTLNVPYYLSRTAPLTGSWRAGGPPPAPFTDTTSRNLTRFNPVPAATATFPIPLIVSVPNAMSPGGGARPPNGWPVLIFQHGITGDRSQMLAIADTMAQANFVVAAIDQPLHGVPAAAVPLYQQANERHFNLDLVNNATGATGADGAIDPSGTHFINLSSLITSRDNLRQAAADLIVLSRSLPNLELTGDTTPDIDPTRIHFLGHSLGGIVGTTFLGVTSGAQVRTATLAMPGGEIAQLLRDSPTFGPRINAGLAAQGLVPGTTLYNQFFRDAQTAVDSGDPINYAAAAAAARPIHLIQVVGGGAVLPDQVVPNSATQRLIDRMGLTRVTAATPPGTTRGFVNFIVGDHGSILSPAASGAATAEMQTETLLFAAGLGATITITNPAVVQP